MKVLKVKRALFLFLLYYSPWANIINLRISPIFVYLPFGIVLTLLIILNFFFPSKLKKSDDKMILHHACYFIFLFALIAYYLFLGWFSPYFLFFNLFAFLLLVIPLIYDIRQIMIDDVLKFANYIIALIATSIVIDYILLENGLLTYQPMYKADAHSYFTRPFGLFGQPSINSSLLCFFFLIKKYLSSIYYNGKSDKKWFLLVLLGVVLQGSGSGFISFFIMLMPIVIPFFHRIKYIVLILFICVAYYLIVSEAIDKLSLSYLILLYDYGILVWHSFAEKVNSITDILFGLPYGINDIEIDYGPLFYISHMGILLFIGFSISLTILFFKVKNRFFRSAIILIAISNLHYPAMFYVVMHVFWPLIFFMADNRLSSYITERVSKYYADK